MAELRRALGQLTPADSLKELRVGLKAAADIAAQEAKLRANSFSFTVSDTIRAIAAGNIAYVAGGKASLRYYGWADFGSRTPRRGQPRSMGPWAKSGPGPRGGRFIYPALEMKSPEIAEAVATAMENALHRLGF